MTTPRTGTVPVPSSPAARRSTTTWRDPRLILGVAVVALSALLGARLMAGADDTVAVWAARTQLAEGTTVGPGDLEPRRVRFPDDQDANRYLSADSAIPSGATLSREVGRGELLPRAAVTGSQPSLVHVPVPVNPESVPATVRGGSVVDVWVTAEIGAGGERRASLVFDDVVVVAAPGPGNALSPSATRQVIVGVPEDADADLAEALARAATGTTVITKQG